MIDHANHRARPSVRASVSVILVLGLAGLLFTANARLAKSNAERHPDNLAGLVELETKRVEQLQSDVDALRDEVDKLAESGSRAPVIRDEGLAERTSLVSGAAPVRGSGLIVELNDAPAGQYGPDIRPDDLVVHQQDLEAVINALWSGGAEAMTLQDQRVLATTAFRCVGNVLSLHGRVYSPPYRVQVIGDPDRLRAALDASEQVSNYREWVDVVGLGWSVTTATDLELVGGTRELVYAEVPDGTQLLP